MECGGMGKCEGPGKKPPECIEDATGNRGRLEKIPPVRLATDSLPTYGRKSRCRPKASKAATGPGPNP